MTSARKGGREPQRENFVGQSERDDPPADREDVRVVVLARESRRVQIVAERGPYADHLVRRNLLALPAPAEDDAAIGAFLGDRAADRETDRRIVDRRFAVRAAIVHGVAETRERFPQMFLQQKARMIGADGDSHSV